MTITDTPTEVVMTVTARNEVCGDVTAAVYAMPENRLYPWPQTKVESETFKLKPGVTRNDVMAMARELGLNDLSLL